MVIGYHASHEQFAPSELLRLAQKATSVGFEAINSSDHFHPWSERQAHSGFSFPWMGAALFATAVPFSVVCAPGQRYHPAIVAQAAATLAEMFPGRLCFCLGSGEALNEKITGDPWPIKGERNARLLECTHIIRRLLDGETVTHYGRVKIEEARLYTLPAKKPLLFGAAVTKETAKWIGGWADGLITVSQPLDDLRGVISSFREGGGQGKPMYLKVQLSYARDSDVALAGAFDQWRTNILPSELLDDLWQVKQFDAAAQFIRKDDLNKMIDISDDPELFVEKIKSYQSLGFERIVLHNVNRLQDEFIEDFSAKVLPFLKS